MSEREARNELARYCARLWNRALVRGSSGNVSLRLDDGDLLVTPASASLSDLRRRQLVRVDPAGKSRNPLQHPSSELPLHLAAYRARPEIRCVIHTHPTFCVVWSKTGSLFARDTVGASESLGTCAWTPYRKNGTQDLAELCAVEFARGIDIVLMERHGLSVLGATLEDAFLATDQAEEAARVAYFSRVAGISA